MYMMKRKFKLSVVDEHDKNGYYAFSPQLQGCYSQGETCEEVMANIKDANQLHLEDFF
jgi:predicted RNase H-like HicB family nuclease